MNLPSKALIILFMIAASKSAWAHKLFVKGTNCGTLQPIGTLDVSGGRSGVPRGGCLIAKSQGERDKFLQQAPGSSLRVFIFFLENVLIFSRDCSAKQRVLGFREALRTIYLAARNADVS